MRTPLYLIFPAGGNLQRINRGSLNFFYIFSCNRFSKILNRDLGTINDLMKPPICTICLKEFALEDGGLVSFKKTVSDFAWDNQRQSHPPWMVWFCADHILTADRLNHLTKTEALKILQEK